MASEPAARILLVDDDPVKRYTIAKTLARAGFVVQEASTGHEALQLVIARPDLIVLDVKLPDISGLEVCRRIKSDPATREIPVLHISTTFVDLEDRIQGFESGADGYLTSVAEPLELVANIRALLRTRKAEDAAQLSTRQWQTTFDAISDGVMLLNRSGNVVQVNRTLEHIMGRPWIEIIGKELTDLWGEFSKSHESIFTKMVASGSRESRDVSLGDRWLHVSVDPIQDEEGTLRGAICLVSDITDQKRMQTQLLQQAEKLKEASQRKDEFLAMLAHELRNPLAPLSNSLEIIQLHGREIPLIEQSLEIARRQIQHIARLLEDLLDVSRITRGKVEIRTRPLDFRTIITNAVQIALPLAKTCGQELSAVLPPEPVLVEGDPTRLEQIVSNLLNNASKYTEAGGQITISLTREENQAVLRVRDTGIGISSELQDHIFDLFVQAERSLDRAQGGLGIGLTLVRSLVELHGGQISVSSAGAGKGSEFAVTLPLCAIEPMSTTTAPSRRTGPRGRPLHILIVDDNRDAAQSLAKVLELKGEKVLCTYDGLSAVELAAAQRPDVILLDIGLPGIDGYQVAEHLRRQRSVHQLKIIAVSGYGGELDQERALRRIRSFPRKTR